VIIAGLAFLQNLRHGHYELAIDRTATNRRGIHRTRASDPTAAPSRQSYALAV
jgi:hypothetical protein